MYFVLVRSCAVMGLALFLPGSTVASGVYGRIGEASTEVPQNSRFTYFGRHVGIRSSALTTLADAMN